MKYTFINLVCVLFVLSCTTKKIKILINPLPVFSEIDTFEVSEKGRPFSKHDYFLISGNLDDKEALKYVVNEFCKKNVIKECGNYGNYIMFFYKESSNLNNKSIKKGNSEYRYKIFDENKNLSYIASFNCWDSMPIDSADFQKNFSTFP